MAQNFDLEIEKEKLLKINERNREAHFTNDASLLFDDSDSEFISVSNGDITLTTPTESKAFFANYFKSVEYTKWDDLRDPIIRFSDDGTMAYVIVEKDVAAKVSRAGAAENSGEQRLRFAWITIYKKEMGEWKAVCVVSTNEPPK